MIVMTLKTLLCVLLVLVGYSTESELTSKLFQSLKPKNSNGKLWALLVAGSSGYNNYRHQADVSHAYQIVRKHGIPKEQIIVMMYDDIAYNADNPTPGALINKPNGTNVYDGLIIDYRGDEVTPENFLNALRGRKKGRKHKKVIKSDHNDHIFVYFADHGAPGLITFPNGVLHARQLNVVIRRMHRRNKFAKMVFYIEACESGSMFGRLLKKNINVYATTAANSHESSYACYYDELRQTYLGDVYSVNWMQDSDVENDRETLNRQYSIVRSETNASHVKEFGDLSIGKMTVGKFQGLDKWPAAAKNVLMHFPDAVDARDVPIAILKRKIADAKFKIDRVMARRKLRKVLRNRNIMNTKVLEIVQKVSLNLVEVDKLWTKKSKLRNYECYESAVKYFDHKCFSIKRNEYALSYLHKFVNLCEAGKNIEMIKIAMDEMCKGEKLRGVV